MRSNNYYIEKIQKLYYSEHDFDELIPIFNEYKLYLESKLKKNKNIEDVCQLAAVYDELRLSTKNAIQLIENFIREVLLSNNDLYRAYVNLAYYYYDNYNKDPVAYNYAKKAIKLCPDRFEAYYALGLYCFDCGDFKQAKENFHKCCLLNPNADNQYNLAVTYIKLKDYSKAYELLKKLLPGDNDKIKYTYAVCCCLMEKYDDALHFVNDIIIDYDISSDQAAYVYYSCGQYEYHNKMYDDYFNYYPESSWLAPYFYCLKVQGKFNELDTFYNKIIDEKTAEIEIVIHESIDENYSADEQENDLIKLLNEKNKIVSAYIKVLNSDYKPEIEPFISLKYKCFLIDCPLHQKIKKVN